MMFQFVDCQGFGGAFSVGAALAGWILVGKREKPGGFGIPLMEANRLFLGDAWKSEACDPQDWTVPSAHVDAVIGTPPCAAFSGMTAGYEKHGMRSPINDCMWDLMRYAARVRPAAVIMESVSQAYTSGAVLMAELARELCHKSGLAYRTTHVIQDNYSLGGVTKRKRYFLVLSQVPFGVEVPRLKYLPTVRDALTDLREQPRSWEAQPYASPPTWWSYPLRSGDGLVDGHDFRKNRHSERLHDLIDGMRAAGIDPWLPGEPEECIPQRYYEHVGDLPESWQYEMAGGGGIRRDKHLLERGWKTGGFAQTKYWDWDKPGSVINGAGPHQVWHPDDRQATHREVARLMGFPDDWQCGSLKDDGKLHSYWGKGTSVHPAQWIMTWLRESLEGNPGGITGQLLPDGSHLINVSKHWQAEQQRLLKPPLHTVIIDPASQPAILQLPIIKPARVKKPRPEKPVTEKAPRQRRQQRPQEDIAVIPSTFICRPEDVIVAEYVFGGKYRQLEHVMRRGDRYLDLGAHVGTFTCWAFQHGASYVAAVEMLGQNADVLAKNVAGGSVDIIRAAVTAEHEGGFTTALLGKRANPLRASLLGAKKTEVTSRYQQLTVPTMTLETLIPDFKPDIVKFDIEGGEGALTPHATLLASNKVRAVIGTLHAGDERQVTRAQQLHDAMLAAGYRASRPAPAKPSGWPSLVMYTLKMS